MESQIKEILTPEIIDLKDNGSLKIYTNNKPKSSIVILIIPGGSYAYVGFREGIPVVNRFLEFEYSCALLNYKCGYGCYPTNYNQGLKSIEILSKKFKKIIIMGFSAGGHLTAMLGTSEKKKLINVVGMILCYPVISFIEKFHEKSVENFLGDNSKNEKYKKEYSIENRVSSDTLPTFIWTIKGDKTVPYENTLMMIEKLRKFNVKFKQIIYESGIHGISLADETTVKDGNKEYINSDVQNWTKIACSFIDELTK